MNQFSFKRILIIGVISILGIYLSAKQKPNIVLMFIDDMGYGDIGPFGNKINQTPHLDRMAKEGNVLTQFYVANTACTPSRAALLTGTYANRIGMDGGLQKKKKEYPVLLSISQEAIVD